MIANSIVSVLLAASAFTASRGLALAASTPATESPASQRLAAYFRAETKLLRDACLAGIDSLEEWESERARLRQQLFEMLSLSPLPERTDLQAEVTGKLEEEQFTVEKLHFQSMPGLYATGNLFLPKGNQGPAPGVLYVCGHAFVITNGVSFGNKTAYHRHGAWFARNGYVCLIIDTVQLGEIQGIHHGTYREGMWWWNSRGYSSAGVEAWNCIRALDYLQSRPEVDGARLGVTGRSGGGAYSWWVAALDDRVIAAAPVAGITDLQNHVVDGVVEGHCDCMFMVNTYRWDYPAVAALVAPRPLLICNSDKDSIFPLDGVVRLHSKVAQIYKLYGATNNLGLLITEGPHRDTQDLQLPVFRWFNRHLKGEDPVIAMAATPFFTPAQLRVFDTLPADERTSKIHETFVPVATFCSPPGTASAWADQRDALRTALEEHVFRGWPAASAPAVAAHRGRDATSVRTMDVYEFTSQHDVPLRIYLEPSTTPPTSIQLIVRDEAAWRGWVKAASQTFSEALREEVEALGVQPVSERTSAPPPSDGVVQASFVPRGIGLSAWGGNERKQVQIRRRFMLLGQTVDGMRVWDIQRAIQALQSIEEFKRLPIDLQAEGAMGVNVLYAAVFEPGIRRVTLSKLPTSHRNGPDYLNVMRFMDIPQAVALAADHCDVVLHDSAASDWEYPSAVALNLGWPPNRLRIRSLEIDTR
ncbi:MAG: alpha/beta hydrolase family protein [Verrucomicrobiia bacterium]